MKIRDNQGNNIISKIKIILDSNNNNIINIIIAIVNTQHINRKIKILFLEEEISNRMLIKIININIIQEGILMKL